MKVDMQTSKNPPEDLVSHTEQSVEICPSGRLLNLAHRIIYSGVPWLVIQRALGPINHQVVHKAHSTHMTKQIHIPWMLRQRFARGVWAPPHTACTPSPVRFSEQEQLKSTDLKCPWGRLQPSTSAEWKEWCVRKRQSTEVSLFLCI